MYSRKIIQFYRNKTGKDKVKIICPNHGEF